MKQCGIYKIHCIGNNKTYIGSSNNIERRFKEHLRDLRCNKHVNNYLQNSFSKYGENSFSFSIITTCYEQERFKLEQFYISITENLFNYITEIENCSLKNRYISKETLTKMKEAQNKRVWTSKHKKISTDTISKYRHLAIEKTSIKIKVIINEEITEYPSILEASRCLKIDPKTIRKKLRGEEVKKSKAKNIQIYYGREC